MDARPDRHAVGQRQLVHERTERRPALGLDTSNGNFTYSGTIPAGIGLAKLGANNLTLNTAQSITGNLINGTGTLTMTSSTILGGIDGSYNPLGIVQIHQGMVQVNRRRNVDEHQRNRRGRYSRANGHTPLSGGTVLVPLSGNTTRA